MTQERMKRVDASNPCPVCGKPDWCLRAKDGSAAICARIESGKRCGDAGWLHRLNSTCRASTSRRIFSRSIPLGTNRSDRHDLDRLAARYQRAVDLDRLAALAERLGLTPNSLRRFAVGWSDWHRAWSFPMRDAAGGIIGIHLRRPDGTKLAVRGSRQGLFLPADLDPTHLDPNQGKRLLIGEGLTDAAALVDMDMPWAVGRPSCTSALNLVAEYCRTQQPEDVVIVADGDPPGQRGAGNLAAVLLCYVAQVRVITPPTGIKDMRVWFQSGATRADLDTAIHVAPARQLAITRKAVPCGQQ